MAKRKILSCALAALIGLSSVFGEIGIAPLYVNEEAVAAVKETALASDGQEVIAEDTQVGANNYGLRDNIQDGVILHCFNWKYNDIKAELQNIAEAGFTAVQTSPAQRDDTYGKWYMMYQPQSFSISTNVLGSKEDLRSLCTEAEKYGIKIVVDVVANHMRGDGNDVDASMQRNSHPDYWHEAVGSSDDANRWQVTHGDIGMWDLNSENSDVQNIVANYIKELKDVGVDGIRWDAAKHIGLPSEGCEFWSKVTIQGLYHYGEILNKPGPNPESIMKEYTNYMSVTDGGNEGYCTKIREGFERGSVSGAIGNWSERGLSKDKLVYWAESHDTYSNNGQYGEQTEYTDQNIIDRAYAIVAGQGKATSLYFSRPFQTEKESIMAGVKGSTHFTSKEVAAVNHLHNNCVGERDYYVNGGSVAAVCRESGAVIVKASGSGQVSVQNGGGTTAPGTYTDEVSGSTWTVTADTISGNIGDSGIAVIYKDNGTGGNITQTSTPSNTTTPGGHTTVGANTIIATKPSGWNELYIYAYQSGVAATKLTGEWPGTKMTADSEGKYTYTMDSSISSAKIIFASGASGSQDPQDVEGQACGFDYVGGKAYSYDGGTWSEVSISTATEEPIPTPEQPIPMPIKTPDTEPTLEPTQRPTSSPVEDNIINVSVPDKSSFDEETLSVKITLKNENTGTYTVDDGPERSFNSGDSVIIGEGKIADTDITLKVSTGNKTETFTYKKVFNIEKAVVKTSVIARIQSLFEVVADVAEVNASLSNEALALQYATNAVGVGKSASITVDDSISDWSSDMLIAQGAANDDPRVYRPNSMYEVGIDTYALYGAYDSSNLYLMWEMTNVQDVVAPSDDYPLTQGTMYLNMNIPFFIAIDTGKDDVIGNKGQTSTGGTLWDSGITIDSAFNRIIAISTNGANGPYVYGGDSSGLNLTELYSKAGGGEANAGKSGIQFGFGTGILSNTVVGIDGGYGENNNRVVGDVCNDGAAWVDFNTKGHTSATMDYHYEMAIPLEELGISASDVESDGLGVLLIATSGKSGMDCLPYDVSMNDNADLDDSAGSQENNSFEKSDEDEITCSFARVGKGGDGVVIRTPRPATEPPASEIPASETPASETPGIETPATTSPVSDKISVNFGADYSSPQYDSRELILKAELKGGASAKSYEFYVDNEIVQEATEKDSYTWKGEAGKHTIKVVVEYSSGKVSCEKNFEIYSSGITNVTEVPKTEKPIPTQTANANTSPTPTNDIHKESPTPAVPTPTTQVTNPPTKNPDEENPDNDKQNSDIKITLTKKNPTILSSAAGQKVNFYMSATGGAGDYTYRMEVMNAAGKKVNLKIKNASIKGYEKEAIWIASKTGTYKVNLVVTDKAGYYNSRSVSYSITNPVTIKTFKASKTSVKKGKTIKFTANATSFESVKYRFKLQKIGSKTIKTLRGYSTKKTYTWKTTAKGKYYVYLQVKDADGNTKLVKKKITVK